MNSSLSTPNRSLSSTKTGFEPPPHTYLDKRVVKSHAKRPRRRSERAQTALGTKRRLVALAKEINEPELVQRLNNCHAHVAVLTCGDHVAGILPNYTCEFRLCPHCARRRSKKHFRNYLPKVLAYIESHRVTPMLLTLTQTHRPETLEASIKRLPTAFQKLTRRRLWKQHFRGGSWSLEVTKGSDGCYHTHIHLLVFRTKFFDVELLRSDWLAVTGDSSVLHLKPIFEDAAGGLREVLKYVAKPLDIARFTPQNLRDFLSIKKMRFFSTFGDFRKFCANYEPSEAAAVVVDDSARDLVEGCACPNPDCQNPLFEVRMSEDDFPGFLQKVECSAAAKRRRRKPDKT